MYEARLYITMLRRSCEEWELLNVYGTCISEASYLSWQIVLIYLTLTMVSYWLIITFLYWSTIKELGGYGRSSVILSNAIALGGYRLCQLSCSLYWIAGLTYGERRIRKFDNGRRMLLNKVQIKETRASS